MSKSRDETSSLIEEGRDEQNTEVKLEGDEERGVQGMTRWNLSKRLWIAVVVFMICGIGTVVLSQISKPYIQISQATAFEGKSDFVDVNVDACVANIGDENKITIQGKAKVTCNIMPTEFVGGFTQAMKTFRMSLRNKEKSEDFWRSLDWLLKHGHKGPVMEPTIFELALKASNYWACDILCKKENLVTNKVQKDNCPFVHSQVVSESENPKHASDWFHLALLGGGDVGGVKQSIKTCYERCLLLDQHFVAAWNNLGALGGGVLRGRTYSAKSCVERSLDLNPDSEKFWNNLGVFGGGVVSGRTYSKKECYAKALEIDPHYAFAWFDLARAGGGKVGGGSWWRQWFRGDFYSQKECLIKTAENDVHFKSVWNRLGNVGGGEVRGRFYSPKECFVKALEMNPRGVWAPWYALGVVGGGVVRGIHYDQGECFIKSLEDEEPNVQAWTGVGFNGGGVVSGRTYSPKECFIEGLETARCVGACQARCVGAWDGLAQCGGGTVHGVHYSSSEASAKRDSLPKGDSLLCVQLG